MRLLSLHIDLFQLFFLAGTLLPVAHVSANVPEPLPEPVRIVEVGSASELVTALNAAQPGDHIVLADGTYVRSGGFFMSKNGSETAPIIVRSENLLESVIKSKLTVNGANVWLYGLTFDDCQMDFERNDDGKLLRCQFINYDSNAGRVTTLTGLRIEVAYNQFLDCAGMGVTLRYNTESDSAKFAHLHHNYFKNFYGTGNGHEAIRLGEGNNDRNKTLQVLCEYNLMDGIVAEGETIATKSCSNIVQFNTIINSMTLNNRMGYDNQYIANWVENSIGIGIKDRDNIYVGNYVKNCERGMFLFRGEADPDIINIPTPETNDFPAVRCQLIANITDGTDVISGYQWSTVNYTYFPKGNRIEGHVYKNGSKLDVRVHEGELVQLPETDYEAIPVARKLETFEVGPLAGLDLPQVIRVSAEKTAVLNKSVGTIELGWEGEQSETEISSIILFNLAALPPDATILGAEMEFAVLSNTLDKAGLGVQVLPILAPWGEQFPYDRDDFTIGHYPSLRTTVLPSDLGDGQLNMGSSGLMHDVQNWVIDPDSNHGWLVAPKGTPESIDLKLAGSGYRVPEARPVMKIQYIDENLGSWGRYRLLPDNFVCAHGLLGWITVKEVNNWIYSYALERWLYADPDLMSEGGMWIFLHGDLSARSASPPSSAATSGEWILWPVVDQMIVDSSDYFGWLDISQGEWVFQYTLSQWLFLDDSLVSDNGAWFYLLPKT